MTKELIILKKENIKAAVDDIENSINTTLGPGGKTIIINKFGMPTVTKDGISIAKEIQSGDPVKNTLLRIICDASAQVSKKVGDGTTSACVISTSAISKLLDDNWPITKEFRDKIVNIINKICAKITEQSISCNDNTEKSQELLKMIANVSSNGDLEISKASLKALATAGVNGTVILDYAQSEETFVKDVIGYQYNRGIANERFSNIPGSIGFNVINPLIVVGTKPISFIEELQGPIEACLATARPLIIFCNSIMPDVIAQLLFVKEQRNVPICVCGMPGTGESVSDFADDIASYCQVEHITLDHPQTYNDIYKDKSDWAKNKIVGKVISNIATTSIILNDITHLDNRVTILESLLQNAGSETRKNDLSRRISMYKGTISTVYVGGRTSIEIQEKIDRFDDTIHALKSALRNGVVVGAAFTMYKSIEMLSNEETDLETKKLYDLVSDIVMSIKRRISKNISGDEDSPITLNNIYDPTEAQIEVLKSGFSSALNLLGTTAIITEVQNGRQTSNTPNKR